MTVEVQVQTTGFAELEAKLRILREQFGVKTGGIIYKALQAGSNLIRDEAKRRAPSRDPVGFTQQVIRLQAQYMRTLDKGQRRKLQTGIARALSLIRSQIVAYKIPSGSTIAEGRPTVIIRVRNVGWGRFENVFRRGRAPIRFNRPGTSPGYWWWVEFGTSRFPARPFLRPAFETRARDALDIFKRYIQIELALKFGSAFKKAA